MPQRVQIKLYKLGVGVGPTLSEKYNVGSPHAKRDS